METGLRIALLAGVLVYLSIIFYLLKKEKLSIQYSIIWLMSGAVLLLFALVPYIVLVLGDIFRVINPVNFVFLVEVCFILFILLSLSAAVSGFTKRIKTMSQKQALLEARVRELEAKLSCDEQAEGHSEDAV